MIKNQKRRRHYDNIPSIKIYDRTYTSEQIKSEVIAETLAIINTNPGYVELSNNKQSQPVQH